MSPDLVRSKFPRRFAYIPVALFIAFCFADCTDSGAIVPNLNGQISDPWPTFRGNFQRSGQSQYRGAQTGGIAWKQSLDSTEVFSTPAVSRDSVIYVGTSLGNAKGNFYAVDFAGGVRWVFHVGSGVDSSPTIGTDGTIYFGAYDGAVYALSREGAFKWKYQTAGPIGLSSATIDRSGQLFICSLDSNLYCLDASGSLRWKSFAGRPIGGSAALGQDGSIYVHGEELIAFDEGGVVKWSVPIDTPSMEVVSTPAVGPDGTVYVQGETRLTAVHPSGTILWTYTFQDSPGSALPSPAVSANGTIYVAFRKSVYAFEQNGTLKWVVAVPLVRIIESSPAISIDGTIFIGASPFGGGKNFYALTPEGTILFSLGITNYRGFLGDITASPVITQERSVIVGSDNGGFGLAKVF